MAHMRRRAIIYDSNIETRIHIQKGTIYIYIYISLYHKTGSVFINQKHSIKLTFTSHRVSFEAKWRLVDPQK